MSAIATPAIILATLRYGETSKIVRLATRDHGVQSAIARGANRPKSRFGAALQVLSTGSAQLILSTRSDLHTLVAFDLQDLPVRLTTEVPRFATAAALAEVMLRFAPAAPHPEAYDALQHSLGRLAECATAALPAESLAALWRVVEALGFRPALEECVRDGVEIDAEGTLAFSAAEGGALCLACARGAETTNLPVDARASLAALVEGADPLPVLDSRHAAAHRRLLARYIRYHLGEGAELPALEFWLTHAWPAP